MVKSMKAVRFRFVSTKNLRWIGIYVFRTFTISPIYDFYPKTFYRRTLVKYMANSFTRSITLFAFRRRFNIHFPKANSFSKDFSTSAKLTMLRPPLEIGPVSVILSGLKFHMKEQMTLLTSLAKSVGVSSTEQVKMPVG